MDNRPLLFILWVALSCTFTTSSANTSAAPTATTNNVTSPMTHTVTSPMTHNVTSPMTHTVTSPMTHNVTSPMTHTVTSPMTHNVTSAMTHNVTSAMTHTVTSPMTHNVTSQTTHTVTSPTTHNMTSPTTHNMTSPTTHNMTSAPQLTVNTTVETLDTPVSNTGCGTEQLCASEPSNCDPSTGASCFFFSAKQQPGSQNLEFSLSGESEGYIAATLSPDATLGDNDPTYICANNNSFVQFFSTVLVNGSLTQTELSVNSVKGKVNGKKIQCTFTATVPNSATRRPRGAPTDAAILISTGAFNNNSGTLGSPTAKFSSDVVNLSNPNTTVTNQLSTNTTSSPTTAHAITFQQTLMQVLLISVGALSLALV